MKYVYPAIFTEETDGKFSVNFPDIQGCYTGGDDLHDALFMAEDVLSFSLFDLERENKPIPKASDIKDIKVKKNEFVNYIRCDTIAYQKKINNKAIKKTLTIPKWLNDLALEKNINFSHVLQEALEKMVI